MFMPVRVAIMRVVLSAAGIVARFWSRRRGSCHFKSCGLLLGKHNSGGLHHGQHIARTAAKVHWVCLVFFKVVHLLRKDAFGEN